MRYFINLAYKGTNYFGWQFQPNDISVQQVVQEKMSILLNQPIEVLGCGRTDRGVHASKYYLHFDFDNEFPSNFMYRMNQLLPKDIAFRSIHEVADEAHARFDATSRSYTYHILFNKSPFEYEINSQIMYAERMDLKVLQQAADILLEYKEFTPFCKTNADNRTMLCDITVAKWILKPNGDGFEFHVTSDRFLRGMIRLIVGMCVNVAMGKLDMDDVRKAMDTQTLLTRSWSAPPEGLFLSDVRYPYI